MNLDALEHDALEDVMGSLENTSFADSTPSAQILRAALLNTMGFAIRLQRELDLKFGKGQPVMVWDVETVPDEFRPDSSKYDDIDMIVLVPRRLRDSNLVHNLISGVMKSERWAQANGDVLYYVFHS